MAEPKPTENKAQGPTQAQAQAQAQKRYRVLDWGAGTEDAPCQIHYLVKGVEVSAKTGDVISDIPTTAIGRRGQEDIRSFILGTHIEEVK